MKHGHLLLYYSYTGIAPLYCFPVGPSVQERYAPMLKNWNNLSSIRRPFFTLSRVYSANPLMKLACCRDRRQSDTPRLPSVLLAVLSLFCLFSFWGCLPRKYIASSSESLARTHTQLARTALHTHIRYYIAYNYVEIGMGVFNSAPFLVSVKAKKLTRSTEACWVSRWAATPLHSDFHRDA